MTHKLSSQDTDPLASCVVPGITPRIYRLSAAYATIEDTSVAKAGNRWKYLRLNFPDDISHKLGTVTCVDEAGMLLILKTMKETTQKSQALRVRGVVDDADGLRVREIVLHSEGHVVKIQVCYFCICIYPLGWKYLIQIDAMCCRSTIRPNESQ